MASTLRGSDGPLTDRYDVALLDLDGVVYVGPDAVPGAPAALKAARAQGMRLAFVTNNAARPPAVVAEHLTELGIEAEPAEVVTSAQAAARYLADHLDVGAHVLVVGTSGLEEALRERNLVPVFAAGDEVAAVVQGYSPDLNWRMLAEGAVAINRGVLWVATNGDPTVPSARGPLPGNGSLVAALRYATRATPVVTGKPDPTMHRESLLRTKAEHPIVVGDRLDTDIEGANAVGCASLLVLSGVTTATDLLSAGERLRPTYLAADVGGLLARHPEPVAVNGGVQCGAWHATTPQSGPVRLSRVEGVDRVDDPGRVEEVNHSEDELDALRALCAAVWTESTDAQPARDGSESAKVVVEPGAGGDSRAAAGEVLERFGLGR